MSLENQTASPIELLQFYIDCGADEAIAEETADHTRLASVSTLPAPAMPQMSPAASAQEQEAETPGSIEAQQDARELAAAAKTVEELKAALEGFKGLALKRTARQIVFADGNPKAKVMLVGEAPGADEDRLGRPFVGVSGQLLDRMLASIGLSREENVYISNIINWRPPGNRNPSDAEIAISLPFILRHIELINPSVVIFAGGVSAQSLIGTSTGITKLRGKWVEHKSDGLEKPIPALPMFHPAYLLRSPQQKKLAWADLLKLKDKLKTLGIL